VRTSVPERDPSSTRPLLSVGQDSGPLSGPESCPSSVVAVPRGSVINRGLSSSSNFWRVTATVSECQALGCARDASHLSVPGKSSLHFHKCPRQDSNLRRFREILLGNFRLLSGVRRIPSSSSSLSRCRALNGGYPRAGYLPSR